MQGQFQKPIQQKQVEYGNPFELLLDRAYKPQELKRYVEVKAPETIVAIDVCAYCGRSDCSCTPRRVIKVKL